MAGTIRRAIDAEERRCAGAGLRMLYGLAGLPAAVAAGIRRTTRANPPGSDSRDRPKLLLRPSVWLPGITVWFAIGAVEMLRGEALHAIVAFAIAAGACLFMGLIWVTRHR